MKRIFAFILFFVFMTFKCLTWVPSAAATGIPAFDAFYYAILQTLGMAYTNGVEMDLAPAIADVREAIPDYLQQPDVALKYLLRDYAGKAWDYMAYNWENSSTFEDVALAETAAIGLANASGVSVPTLQDIVSQWSGKALDNDKDITTPINTNTVAFWNKFNKLWINQYLEKINYVAEDTPDLPDLPYNIEACIDLINGSGFEFIKNAPVVQVRRHYSDNVVIWSPNTLQPYSSSTFYTYNANGTNLPWNVSQFSGSNQGFFISNSGIDNIYIVFDSTSNLYKCTITKPNNRDEMVNASYGFYLGYDNNYGVPSSYGSITYNYGSFQNGSGFDGAIYGGNNPWYSSNWSSKSLQNETLEGILNDLARYVRNANIFVDGNLISIAGISTPVSNFNSSVPNAVIDTGTDDGNIVANPIYWVVDNNTGTPIDSQINLDKLIDYLKGVIDGTNDDTTVDFGDLVDAGIIEKEDGSAITDADVIAIPIADVIDDAIARADPISIPIAITGTLPPLPPLPPFFPTPDFPEGDPTSGFNGMSVLARIINITNQSLPDELVVTFYGVMFGAIVLGLIKILHK